MITWIMERLREPSTWKGIILLASMLGMSISPEMKEAIIAAGTSLIGAIWVFQKEAKGGNAGTSGDAKIDSGTGSTSSAAVSVVDGSVNKDG